PRYAKLVDRLFTCFPLAGEGVCKPSDEFLSMLSPSLKFKCLSVSAARTECEWASLLSLSSNSEISAAVGTMLVRVAKSIRKQMPKISINGVRRVDQYCLHASVLVFGESCDHYEYLDEDEENMIEIVFVYDYRNRADSSWKLYEVRIGIQDELCYWRQWSETVGEAELFWIQNNKFKEEKQRIKAALLELKEEAIAMNHHNHGDNFNIMRSSGSGFDSDTSIDSRSSTLNDEDDEDDYWNRYCDSSERAITPSVELCRSLKVIHKFSDV
ncbi:hypothetical protein V1511DRAFT_452536, partial [Dipodascopsis uninucleata]